jgi:hypothetical protein
VALSKQQKVLERLGQNTKDEKKFEVHNANLKRTGEELQQSIDSKQQKIDEFDDEIEAMGWAAQQLDKIEALTPRLEKAANTPRKEQRGVVSKTAPSSSRQAIMERLQMLSSRLNNIVDALE